MNKTITSVFLIINVIFLIVINFLDFDKNLLNKISIFLTATFSLLLAFLTGLVKGKKGLINGLLIGISIATISTIIHYVYAKDFFNLLYIRMAIIILSAASGGVLGVNKKHPN